MVNGRKHRRVGAEQPKVIAIAFSGLEREAVAPHQLRELS
jgi:hypothetical protein